MSIEDSYFFRYDILEKMWNNVFPSTNNYTKTITCFHKLSLLWWRVSHRQGASHFSQPVLSYMHADDHEFHPIHLCKNAKILFFIKLINCDENNGVHCFKASSWLWWHVELSRHIARWYKPRRKPLRPPKPLARRNLSPHCEIHTLSQEWHRENYIGTSRSILSCGTSTSRRLQRELKRKKL